MLLADLVRASDAVAATRSRKTKLSALAGCIAALGPEDVAPGVSFLAGELPMGRIGLGYSAVFKNPPTSTADGAALSIGDVVAALNAIKAIAGKGSVAARRDRWLQLLHRATADEQPFLRKLVVGELRQGALESLVADAVAAAADVDSDAMRRAVMLSGSLATATRAALDGGDDALAAFSIELMRPLQPMLASTAETAADAIERHGTASFEYKLDGARIQVHRRGDDVRVFTRNLREVTYAVPEVVTLARSLSCDSVVLDGEVLALRADGTPHVFQTTMRRFGRKRDVAALAEKLPLSPFFFDILHLDGDDLLDRPTTERFAVLDQLVPEAARIPRIQTSDAATGDEFFEQALEAGHEGVMAKALDAPYHAGRRGHGWFKLKNTHTLDLVVVAVDWGSGRRKGWLSNIHLGARDGDGFAMIGKTFKGMTDDTLRWQTERFTELRTDEGEYTVRVRPEQVVEITFNDVQASPHYNSGYALRHARVKAYRDDKSASEADTIETVAQIFAKASGRDG